MKSLLVPFWVWNLILYPIYFALYFWKKWDANIFIKDLAEIIITVDKVPFLGATWFLPGLFWISLLFCFFYLASRKYHKYGNCIVVIAFVFLFCFGILFTLPYRISRNLVCGLFYMLGFFFSQSELKHKVLNIYCKYNTIIVIICLCFFVFCTQCNSVSLGDNLYGSKVLFVLGTLMAIYAVLFFSKMLCVNMIGEIFSYLGKKSLGILIWQFLAFRITIIVQIFIRGESVKHLVKFPVYDATKGWWLVYIVTGVVGSVIIENLVKKINCIQYLENKGIRIT